MKVYVSSNEGFIEVSCSSLNSTFNCNAIVRNQIRKNVTKK